MSNLSQALQKYYHRQGNKIVFRDNQSLNQFALAMWENLDFHQVDASVLSRVLKGDRLFTLPQLKVFCRLLALPSQEEEYLCACLQQDRSLIFGQYTNSVYISSSLARELISDLTTDAFGLFYAGEYDTLIKKHELIQQLTTLCSVGSDDHLIRECLGFSLYLNGRVISLFSFPSQAIKNVQPVCAQLLKLSRQNQSGRLYGYAHALLSDAHYVAGGYSFSPAKNRYYLTAIKHAKTAISSLPRDDSESMFAYGSMVASAYYAHDEGTTLLVRDKINGLITLQPPENYVSAIHLSSTLSKALAAQAHRGSDPFSIVEFAQRHFRRQLTDTGIHEISEIKEEVETMLLLKINDQHYISQKLKTGIDLATRYRLSRHKRYLSRLLLSL